MQSSQQAPGVNEHSRSATVVHVPPSDHQNCSSRTGEHYLKQSPMSSSTPFSLDFPAMELNESPWIDTVDNKNTEEITLTFFQSQLFGEHTTSNARSAGSDEVLAESHVDLELNRGDSPTAAPAQDSPILLKIDVPAQGDFTTSHETHALTIEDFPSLPKSLGSKTYKANGDLMNNTLRENAHKIICDESKGDCNQDVRNIVNMTSKDVESNSEVPGQSVLNGITQTASSRTWSKIVNSQSNSEAVGLGSAQEVYDLKVTVDDETFEQITQRNLERNDKVLALYHEDILKIDEEIAENGKHTRSLLDSIWKIFEDAKQRRHIRILDGLKKDLKTLYTKNMSQNLNYDSLPAFHFLPLSTAFDVSALSTNGSLRKITTDKQLFPNCHKTNSKNVVLFGKPNYGKTTFCSCLAFNWTVSKDFVLRFTLCVSVHVSQLKIKTSVPDAIVAFLCELLNNCSKTTYKKEEIRSALLSIEDLILFVIDGFDELFADEERKMMRFLFDRNEFRESTVFITARPIVNESFVERFKHVLHLRGFNFNHLISRLKASTTSPTRIDYFTERFDNDYRLFYLTELPPFFLSCVCKLVVNFQYFKEPNSCVWPLLDSISNLLDREYLHSSGGNVSILFKLGKLMFEALATGYSSFTEQLLREVFSDHLDLLRKCGIFYKEREWQSNMWIVSSKVLMVYYATFYLRRRWSKLKDPNERQLFLDNVFCFGDSTGNYVTAQKDSPRISYYVGVIPEIVLTFERDGLLEKAKFEMCHDVEAVERSHAFESTNLLVRISKRHITRFGFHELEADDSKVEETFQDIFECLDFSDLCVDYEAYYNVYENRRFLNVSVTDGDENNVLRFLCRAGNRRLLDRVHVEFDFSFLESVFSFVRHVVLLVLNGIELDEDFVLKEPCDLVWTLFHAIVKSDNHSSVTLVCYDYSIALSKRLLENISFSVYKCPKRKSTTVEILSTLYNEERVSNFRVYKQGEILTENEMALRLLKTWLNAAERPGISISIF